MITLVIFTGCHLRQRRVITGCTQFEADQLKRLAAHHGWSCTERRAK